MDWIQGIKRAIDYIEDNLLEKIDFAEVAKCAYSSSVHFQRTFSILTGITVGEYIRNRKLSLAGQELSMSKSKVTDIAFKYGYDSAEGFTKAFTRYHGVTPSMAKGSGINLKSCGKLSIQIILKGGVNMDYRIEKKPAFKIAGKKRHYSCEDEGRLKEIPKFWDECYNNGTTKKLCGYADSTVTGGGLIGACEPLNDTANPNIFNYWIAIETAETKAADNLELLTIPEGTWVVFKCIGPMPDSIQDMYKRIYSEFFTTSEYEHTGGIDFELYPDPRDPRTSDLLTEIWIPIKKAK